MSVPVRRREAGFSVLEVLVAATMTILMLAGTILAFSTHGRASLREDQNIAMEQNLRVAMLRLTDSLRVAGYGVPKTSVSTWVTWVTGFTANPQVTDGGGSSDTVSVAGCFKNVVARLTADAAQASTTLAVASADSTAIGELFNTTTKKLVFIGDLENAVITAVGTSSITIDTNPSAANNQGLRNTMRSGTPVCRVDVRTFQLDTDASGLPRLVRSLNQGGAAEVVADGISDLQLTTAIAGVRYQLGLTARAEKIDPLSGTYATRGLQSNVTLRN